MVFWFNFCIKISFFYSSRYRGFMNVHRCVSPANLLLKTESSVGYKEIMYAPHYLINQEYNTVQALKNPNCIPKYNRHYTGNTRYVHPVTVFRKASSCQVGYFGNSDKHKSWMDKNFLSMAQRLITYDHRHRKRAAKWRAREKAASCSLVCSSAL